jgi:hypothetical protein
MKEIQGRHIVRLFDDQVLERPCSATGSSTTVVAIALSFRWIATTAWGALPAICGSVETV